MLKNDDDDDDKQFYSGLKFESTENKYKFYYTTTSNYCYLHRVVAIVS